MKKTRAAGFSLIEVLAAIGLMALLTVVAAGDIGLFQQRWNFDQDTTRVLNLIRQARTAAITRQNCVGFSAEKWVVNIEPTQVTINCAYQDGTGTTQTPSTVEAALDQIAADGVAFYWNEDPDIDVSGNSNADSNNIAKVVFYPGGQRSEVQDRSGNQKTHVRITWNRADIETQAVLCFHPIAGYPLFALGSTTCPDDNPTP